MVSFVSPGKFELAARTKATRKTIESGIPEHRFVELSFWTQQSIIGIMGN
jgi:hypothetical protein